METIMNNEIRPFEFEGNKVRALADGDEVVFVASDIAKILGYRDAANLARNLDDDERGIHEVSTPSGTQNMTVLTELGDSRGAAADSQDRRIHPHHRRG